MITWLADKVLPGLIVGVVMSAGTWLSHRRLKLHMSRLTTRQLLHIEQIAAEHATAPSRSVLARLDSLDGNVGDLAGAVQTVMAARTSRAAKGGTP
jgi:hypothetical protein